MLFGRQLIDYKVGRIYVMATYHLMSVEARYEVRGNLLLFPDFAPETRGKLTSSTSCNAKAIKPNGAEFTCNLTFHLAHFNCADKKHFYRFVTELIGVSKAELPIGSDIFIEDHQIAFALNLDRRTI